MRVIWKYKLGISNSPTPDVILQLPKGSKILHVGEQLGCLVLWVSSDYKIQEFESRHFFIIGTGHYFDGKDLMHINTVQTAKDSLVWHIFEWLRK